MEDKAKKSIFKEGGEETPRESASEKEEGPPQEEAPIRLTSLAAEKILAIMDSENLQEARLRVKVVGGGCAGFSYDIAFDEKKSEEGELSAAVKEDPLEAGEQLVISNGVPLIVDQMSLMYLRGTEIDYVESLQGSGFKFNNPLATATCACGNSFNA